MIQAQIRVDALKSGKESAAKSADYVAALKDLESKISKVPLLIIATVGMRTFFSQITQSAVAETFISNVIPVFKRNHLFNFAVCKFY